MFHKGTSPISYIVDPQRDGVDNALWKEVDPTIAVASNRFRFNAAEGLIRSDVKFGRFEFSVRIPLTTGQGITNLVNDLEFGLKNLSLGNIGKIMVFADKSEATIALVTYDMYGTAQTTNLIYEDAWGGSSTRFVIEWFNDRVRLLVWTTGDTEFRVLAEHKTSVGSYSLNPYVKAVGAENFDVDYIVVDNTHQNSTMLI